MQSTSKKEKNKKKRRKTDKRFALKFCIKKKNLDHVSA